MARFNGKEILLAEQLWEERYLELEDDISATANFLEVEEKLNEIQFDEGKRKTIRKKARREA